MKIKQIIYSDLKKYEEEFKQTGDDNMSRSFCMGAITALQTVLLAINNSEIPNLSNYPKITDSSDSDKKIEKIK